MNIILLSMCLFALSQQTFAFNATYETSVSVSVEIIFSTAISSVTSEISTLSSLDIQKSEARKAIREIQEYNQTGTLTVFIKEKITIIQSLDKTLSVDDSVDVLISASEIILTK
jgi:S-adenosylmethionine synthetase